MWLSDGLDHGDAKAFGDGLAAMGSLGVFTDEADKGPLAMRPPDNIAAGFGITLTRVPADAGRTGRVAALDARGQILETAPYAFQIRESEAKAEIALPLELRNDTVRIAVMAHESAGAVQLIDARFRRRPVGLVSGASSETQSPYLSDVYYLERALLPYAELHKGTIEQALDSGIAVLMVADIGQLNATEHERVQKFVEEGGVLIRFGGPRLAANADDLVPVRLREGERMMGRAMTWASPQRLTPFADDSPFRGLNISDDVTVSRQVLAEPSVELADHTWARLTDGTPLVTGAPRGRGWIVLFHVAASPGWSTLPISGLYVDMLRRVIELSEGVQGGAAAARTGNVPALPDAGRVRPPGETLPRGNPDPRFGNRGHQRRPAASAGSLWRTRRADGAERLRDALDAGAARYRPVAVPLFGHGRARAQMADAGGCADHPADRRPHLALAAWLCQRPQNASLARARPPARSRCWCFWWLSPSPLLLLPMRRQHLAPRQPLQAQEPTRRRISNPRSTPGSPTSPPATVKSTA